MTELEQFVLESELYESILDIGASEIEYGLESYIQYSKCLEREKMLMESSRDFQFEEFVLEAADEKSVWQKIVSFLKSIFVTYSPEHLCRMIDKMPDDKWVAFRDGGYLKIYMRGLTPMFCIVAVTQTVYEILRLDGKSDTDVKTDCWVDDKCIEMMNKMLQACMEIITGFKENYEDKLKSLNNNRANMTPNAYFNTYITTLQNCMKPLTSVLESFKSYPGEYLALVDHISGMISDMFDTRFWNLQVQTKDDFKKFVMAQFAKPMRKAHKNKNYAECLAKINKVHNDKNPNGKQVSETVDTSAIKSTLIMINKINKFVGQKFRNIFNEVSITKNDELKRGPSGVGDNVESFGNSSDNINSATNSGTSNGANLGL